MLLVLSAQKIFAISKLTLLKINQIQAANADSKNNKQMIKHA